MKNKSQENKKRPYLKSIAINIIAAAVVCFLLVQYVAAAYRINGHSMDSVLKDSERIIVSKVGLGNGNLHRFDIVVLAKPSEPGKAIVKRIIGLPGETIEIRDGDVYINSQKLPEPFLQSPKNLYFLLDNMNPLIIQPNSYFVMGDNRPLSQDSRDFGPIPQNRIFGKAVFRYWPLSRFGKIK